MYKPTTISRIESIYDVRLVILLNVLMDTIETLSLATDYNAELLLSENLYLSTKMIHERGEEKTIEKLFRCYPILREALD